MSRSILIPNRTYKKAWEFQQELYQAKTLESLIQSFVSGIAKVVPADAIAHMPVDNTTLSPSYSYASHNLSIPKGIAKLFISDLYCLKDPCAPDFYEFLSTNKTYDVVRGSDYISSRELENTEFYSEILNPLHIKYYAVLSIKIFGYVFNTPFIRAQGSRPFSDSDMATIKMLAPTIAEAFKRVLVKESIGTLKQPKQHNYHHYNSNPPQTKDVSVYAWLKGKGFDKNKLANILRHRTSLFAHDHLKAVFKKMGVNSSAQLIAKLRDNRKIH